MHMSARFEDGVRERTSFVGDLLRFRGYLFWAEELKKAMFALSPAEGRFWNGNMEFGPKSFDSEVVKTRLFLVDAKDEVL